MVLHRMSRGPLSRSQPGRPRAGLSPVHMMPQEAPGGAVEGMGPHLQQEVGARVLGCACHSTRHSAVPGGLSPSWAQVPHAALGSSSGERGTKIKRRVLRGAGSCQPRGQQGLVATENLRCAGGD